jgi:hypothetical protein
MILCILIISVGANKLCIPNKAQQSRATLTDILQIHYTLPITSHCESELFTACYYLQKKNVCLKLLFQLLYYIVICKRVFHYL